MFGFFALLLGGDVKDMEALARFSNEMSAAIDFRNNASHGGSEIDVNQCRTDRRIVLADLIEVRERNMGLIQHLLALFSFSFT